MRIAALSARLVAYYSRHGLRSTTQRAGLALKRALFSNRQVVFYCDLAAQVSSPETPPSFVKVERKRTYSSLSPQDLHKMIDFWNPKLASRKIVERFERGADLWLIKSKDSLAGYGWTLKGRTVESHYFPLGQNDVHLFDFHVFPEYRGRGMNPFLVSHILRNLAADGPGRAFIEAAEWNQAQLSSLGRTPFRRVGCARKWSIFGRTVVWWRKQAVKQIPAGDREAFCAVHRSTSGEPSILGSRSEENPVRS
jgi:ribosomal protein S18 acetylase RimI-like enzyme